MIWFCGGHGVCSINPGEPGRLQKAVLTWFARYLKGDTSVDTGPRFEWLADDGKWRTASDYPVPTASPLTASGPGSLALTAGATSGQLIAAGPAAPGTPVINLPIPAPKAPAQLVGPPALSLTYTGTAALADTRVYAQVVDLGANLVLGNQVTPIPVMLDGAEHTVRRRLEPIAASASPASRYVLQIVPGTTVYDPQRSAGVLNAARIKIDLPVLGTLSPGPALGAGRRAACRRGSRVIVRLREPRGAERIVVARFYVGAKRVRTVRGSALRRVIRLRVSRRAKRLRVMATTDRGRTLRSTRRLRRCT
jgi:ABC-2 type transport system ATP-binding protein